MPSPVISWTTLLSPLDDQIIDCLGETGELFLEHLFVVMLSIGLQYIHPRQNIGL